MMAPRVEANTSRLLLKIELSSGNMLQRMVSQLPSSFRMEWTFSKFERNQRSRLENAYFKELLSQSNRKRGPVEISELPQKRRGRPLLLGDELEEQVKLFIKVARERGTVVNTETVMGTARGVVISHDANLLLENGGYINITKDWAR